MNQLAEIVKLRIILTCPQCSSRNWIIVQNGDDEPFCECSQCGWQTEDETQI